MTEAKIDGAKDERPVKCPPPMEQTDIKNLITQGPLLDNAETVVEVKTVAELEKPSTDLTKMEEENSNEVVEPEMSQYIGSEKEVNGRKTSGKAEIPEQFLFNQEIPSPGDGAAAVSSFELNLNSETIVNQENDESDRLPDPDVQDSKEEPKAKLNKVAGTPEQTDMDAGTSAPSNGTTASKSQPNVTVEINGGSDVNVVTEIEIKIESSKKLPPNPLQGPILQNILCRNTTCLYA